MRAWDRIPDTPRARVQVQDYLRRRYQRYSFATVLRLARLMEIRSFDSKDVSIELAGMDDPYPR